MSRKAAFINCTFNNISTLIQRIRNTGYDVEVVYPIKETWSFYLKEYSCIVILMGEDISEDIREIIEFLQKNKISILEIDGSQPDDSIIKYALEFLQNNKCKKWVLADEVDLIIKILKESFPKEVPLCNISEHKTAAVASALAIKAIGNRAKRFIYYDYGADDNMSVSNYLKLWEDYTGVKPIVINMRDKRLRRYTDGKSEKEYRKDIDFNLKIVSNFLQDIYGDSIYYNGQICGNSRDFDGNREGKLIIQKHSAFLYSYCLPLFTPCVYFFDNEIAIIARMIGMPKELVNAYKSLRYIHTKEEVIKLNKQEKGIKIPKGKFCGGNCSDCVYWEPYKRDGNDRAYCSWYGHYYWPSERQGCLSYKRR